MEEDLDVVVNDIITQLKGTTALTKKEPVEELDKERLEEFIIKNSGKLIIKTLDIVDDVQAYISSAPEAKERATVSSASTVVSAVGSTINVVVAAPAAKVMVPVLDVKVAAPVWV